MQLKVCSLWDKYTLFLCRKRRIKLGWQNYQRNICYRTSCNYCTGTYVYHGLCDESYFEVQSFSTDRIWNFSRELLPIYLMLDSQENTLSERWGDRCEEQIGECILYGWDFSTCSCFDFLCGWHDAGVWICLWEESYNNKRCIFITTCSFCAVD